MEAHIKRQAMGGVEEDGLPIKPVALFISPSFLIFLYLG